MAPAPCTPEEHVFTAWILGTPCSCGQRVIALREGVVTHEPREAPAPEVVAVQATDAAPVALEEEAHEPERVPEAEQAFPPRRRR